MVARPPQLIAALGILAMLCGFDTVPPGEPAAALRVLPDIGEGVRPSRRGRVRAVALFDGGSATVEVGHGDRWRLVAVDARAPVALGRVRAGELVRVHQEGRVVGEVRFVPVWSPEDVAAWSGPGLRDTDVTDIDSVPGGLWVSLRHAGAALWDGTGWRHLGERTGRVRPGTVAISIDGATRWILTDHGREVVRLAGDGTTWRWRRPDGDALSDIQGDGAGGAWAVGPDGFVHLPDEVVAPVDGRCTRFFAAASGWVVPCEGAAWQAGPPWQPLEAPPRLLEGGVSGYVPRADGAWVALRDGALVPWIGLGLGTPWEPATPGLSPEITGIVRVGDALAVGTSAGLWMRTGDADIPLAEPAGLPAGAIGRLAPGPSRGRAWVATPRGIALVSDAGTATPLPLAPLAAGVEVLDAVSWAGGAAALSVDGLAWLGPRPPRGWSALVAAVGDRGTRLAAHAQGWWVIAGQDAYQLDAKGGLHRWPLDADGVDVETTRDNAIFATAAGMRVWVPGARLLSPTVPVADVRQIVVAQDGAVWARTADAVVRWRPGAVTPFPVDGVRHLAPLGAGVVAASHDDLGLIDPRPGASDDRWRPTADPAAPRQPATPLAAVVVSDGGLFVLDGEGWLWRRRGERAELVASVSGATSLTPAPGGVWALGPSGLWRVGAAPDTRRPKRPTRR